MLDALKQDEQLAAGLPQVEAAVRAGRTTPNAAARQLLAAMDLAEAEIDADENDENDGEDGGEQSGQQDNSQDSEGQSDSESESMLGAQPEEDNHSQHHYGRWWPLCVWRRFVYAHVTGAQHVSLSRRCCLERDREL